MPLKPLGEIRLSLLRVLRSSQMLDNNTCRPFVPNFTQFGQLWNVGTEIPLCLCVKHGFHCANFHETQESLSKICGYVLHCYFTHNIHPRTCVNVYTIYV